MTSASPDLVLVGSGFFALTIADRVPSVLGTHVLVIDGPDPLSGHAYLQAEAATSIQIRRYGSHLLPSSNERMLEN